ncbi:MAG: hypothetical protein J6T51_02910 [Kiritimatiellae bacterium]|nr:hypothetical protein [Kiritimatiellia bacterium]
MSDKLIKTDVIEGGAVYGVRQVEYTVDGVPRKDFIDAVTTAAFRQATAIETATGAYAQVVKARQAKIDDLAQALAYIAKAVGSLKTKGGKSTDKATIDNAAWVRGVADKYEVQLSWESNYTEMTRGNLQKAQTNVQYEIEKENNNLQQDNVTLQSYLTKRDNAYSNASKIVKKANNAAQTTISNIGSEF